MCRRMSGAIKYIFVILAISCTISSSKKVKEFQGLQGHLIKWQEELGEMKVPAIEKNVKGNLQGELKKNIQVVELQKNIIRTLCNAIKESYNEFVQDLENINNDEKLSPEDCKLVHIPALLSKFTDFQEKVNEIVGSIEEGNEKSETKD